jgi:hypothetical protein
LYFSRAIIAPAAIIVLGSGIWLILEGSEWSFSQPWALVGLLLFALAVVGATLLSWLAARIGQAVSHNGAAHLQRLWLVGQAGLLVILVAAFVDMGLKPGT